MLKSRDKIRQRGSASLLKCGCCRLDWRKFTVGDKIKLYRKTRCFFICLGGDTRVTPANPPISVKVVIFFLLYLSVLRVALSSLVPSFISPGFDLALLLTKWLKCILLKMQPTPPWLKIFDGFK